MNEDRPITMSQIAQELGLSRMTVSSVLNGQALRRGISEGTAQRVQAYVAKRGYVPSRTARQLRDGGQEKIGLIHCGHQYAHLVQAFNSLADAVTESPLGSELVMVRHDRLAEGIRELVSRGVTTIVWIQRSRHKVEFRDPSILSYLSNVRCLLYNYHFEDEEQAEQLIDRGFYLVGVNRPSLQRRVARRILELGHEVIVLPEVHKRWAVDVGREYETEGLRALYSAPDIPEHAPRQNYAAPIARNLLDARRAGATCACFGDDVVAGRVMAILRGVGIGIPTDLSIVSFTGDPLSSDLCVPLTTTVMPVAAMVNCIIQIIDGRIDKQRNVFDLEFIERESLGQRLEDAEDLPARLRRAEAMVLQQQFVPPSYTKGLESILSISPGRARAEKSP